MTELVDALEARGFETIASDLPGTWSTDGEWTVTVQTRPVHGGPLNDHCHRVLVYESPPWEIGIDTELAARTTDMSRASAIRVALDRAGYPLDDRQ